MGGSLKREVCERPPFRGRIRTAYNLRGVGIWINWSSAPQDGGCGSIQCAGRSTRSTAISSQAFVYIDHRNDVTIVGTLPESYGEEIIAVGSYYLDQKTNLAEVAFVVSDDWQNHGIGTFLLKHLMRIARRNGIRGFTAEVLTENKPMQAVVNKSNCKVRSKLAGNVYSYEMDFE